MTPLLRSVRFVITQDADDNDDNYAVPTQALDVSIESCGAGPYLVLKTERWAVDHPHELIDVLVLMHQAVLPLFDAFNGRSDDASHAAA
jgi:hypothetical protein